MVVGIIIKRGMGKKMEGSAGKSGTYQMIPVHRSQMCQFNNRGEQSHDNVVISTDM